MVIRIARQKCYGCYGHWIVPFPCNKSNHPQAVTARLLRRVRLDEIHKANAYGNHFTTSPGEPSQKSILIYHPNIPFIYHQFGILDPPISSISFGTLKTPISLHRTNVLYQETSKSHSTVPQVGPQNVLQRYSHQKYQKSSPVHFPLSLSCSAVAPATIGITGRKRAQVVSRLAIQGTLKQSNRRPRCAMAPKAEKS